MRWWFGDWCCSATGKKAFVTGSAQCLVTILAHIEHPQWWRISALVLTRVERKMRVGNFDVLRIECVLQSVQKLAANTPLLKAGDLEATAQYHGRIRPTLDARNLEIADNFGGEILAFAHFPPHFPHHFIGFIDVLPVGNTHINYRISVSARLVGNRGDQAVGHKMDAALIVAQGDITQGDVFHQSTLAAHLDNIALADLVFQQDKKTVEIILDQTLRTKADSNTDHAGGTQERHNGDAQFAQNQHARHKRNQDRGDVTEYALQRVYPLFILGGGCPFFHVPAKAANKLAADDEQYPLQQQDD